MFSFNFYHQIVIFALFHVISTQELNVYISASSSCSSCDGTLPNPFPDLNSAINSSYSQLQSQSNLSHINFQFLGLNYTIPPSSTAKQYFYQWEQILVRNLSISISPQGCATSCPFNFILYLKTQNISFFAVSEFIISYMIIECGDSSLSSSLISMNCFTNGLCCCYNNFSNISDSCYIGNLSVSRSETDRSLFEIWSFTNFTFNNIIIQNLFSVNKITYYSYAIRLKTIKSNISIINSEFNYIYLRDALLKISVSSNILIQNSTFLYYNAFNFIENVTTQTYSFVISADTYVVNLSCVNSAFSNIQFVAFLYISNSSFQNCIFYVKIRTTTLSTNTGMTGFLLFGPSVNTSIVNCSFFQGDLQTNLKGVNKLGLIYLSTYSNIQIVDCNFSNLSLRDARIFYSLSYSQIMFLNDYFTSIDHTCYDFPSSNCLYYLFDSYTYNNFTFSNSSLNNITILADNNLFRIYSTNNVTFINVTLENIQLINGGSNYMINFYSGNTLIFQNMMVTNYSVGYSAGFFNFDNRNLVIFLGSIFIANNPDIIASGQIININTLNVIYVNYTTFGNMCATYRNNFYILSFNNITVYRS